MVPCLLPATEIGCTPPRPLLLSDVWWAGVAAEDGEQVVVVVVGALGESHLAVFDLIVNVTVVVPVGSKRF